MKMAQSLFRYYLGYVDTGERPPCMTMAEERVVYESSNVKPKARASRLER
jgi:hypothetical protein